MQSSPSSGYSVFQCDRPHPPDIPPVRELKDLCDGISLAALVSFYCPEELPWRDVVVSYLPTISDSVRNLMLVYNFCAHSLPCSVFHMMPEDVTYLRGYVYFICGVSELCVLFGHRYNK
jgi:calmodulin-regulated spectrin-associated protein